jgi:uncharacterized membrane protein
MQEVRMAQRSDIEGDAMSAEIERNVAALVRHEAEVARRTPLQQRVADKVTAFAGSMPFVYLHLAVFGGWIVMNRGLVPQVRPWDTSLVLLAMIASVEAIFLSTFVLISQNRMAELSERRAQLGLQISMLAEHETTRMMTLMSAIAKRLDVTTPIDDEVQQLQRDVEPEAVLARIEREDEAKPPPS